MRATKLSRYILHYLIPKNHSHETKKKKNAASGLHNSLSKNNRALNNSPLSFSIPERSNISKFPKKGSYNETPKQRQQEQHKRTRAARLIAQTPRSPHSLCSPFSRVIVSPSPFLSLAFPYIYTLYRASLLLPLGDSYAKVARAVSYAAVRVS